MRIKTLMVAVSILSVMILCAPSLPAQAPQRAVILSHRIENEVTNDTVRESIEATDPTVARLIVIAVKFVPPIPKLHLYDLAIGFGADATEGTSPNLGATMWATDTNDGFWLLSDVKTGRSHTFEVPTEQTRLLFALPNDVKIIKLFYKGTAISDPMPVHP